MAPDIPRNILPSKFQAVEILSSEIYIEMIRLGAERLDANRVEINNLNVFPIPDGDTGDNMYMTIRAGAQVKPLETLSDTASAVSSAMLLGARGNSGVILSRIFAGISEGLKGLASADAPQFAAALSKGVESSYAAVQTPVEGTILTVFREAVESVKGAAEFGAMFASIVGRMEISLKHTPELLEVLRNAGVVDSGGAGLLCIFRGMDAAVRGERATELSGAGVASESVNLDNFGPDSKLEFGYCTEFLLRLQNSKVGNVESFDESVVRDYLCSAGESVVCFRDGSILKAHVHTFTPGEILNRCQQWGEFLTLKIENMTLQHSEVNIKDDFSISRKKYALVAVASGEGLKNSFREAGVDCLVEGGQTMNPSASDFIAAFDKADAETIFVLPNNSNIILAARQAASIYSKSDVRVLPTKDVGSGFIVAASFDYSAGSADEAESASLELVSGVSTGMVSKATRDAEMDGVKVVKDGYVGIAGGKILCAGSDATTVASSLAVQMDAGAADTVLVFSGADAEPDATSLLMKELGTRYPRTEFMLTDGGQPVYEYIIVIC